MASTWLHLFHPKESRLPGVLEWLAQLDGLLRSDVTWDGWEFVRHEYNEHAGFNVATEIGTVKTKPGPVVFIHDVSIPVYKDFKVKLGREFSVYIIHASGPEDIWAACDNARLAYLDGEPRISDREVIAFLILKKLAKQGKWGGTSLNKNFLWSADLPKGGFPKEFVEAREVLNVAQALVRAGLLSTKTSQGSIKYALAGKEIIQPILDAKIFPKDEQLEKFFSKAKRLVSVRWMDFNDT